MRQLSGSHALVTGASRGLGISIALALAKEGVNLTLAARTLADLEAVRTDVAALGVTAIAVACDVTDPTDRLELVTRAESEVSPLDILINNAGIEHVARFAVEDPAQLERTVSVNLTSAMLLTRAVLPGMLARRRGHVLNVASLAGKVAAPYEAAYSASKFGLVGFSQSLRAELRSSGVSCSVVCPGFVRDDGMYARWERSGARAPFWLGTSSPAEVAAAVVRAIREDRAEVIVNPTPLIPALMLQAALPEAHAFAARLSGVTSLFRRAADLDGV